MIGNPQTAPAKVTPPFESQLSDSLDALDALCLVAQDLTLAANSLADRLLGDTGPVNPRTPDPKSLREPGCKVERLAFAVNRLGCFVEEMRRAMARLTDTH